MLKWQYYTWLFILAGHWSLFIDGTNMDVYMPNDLVILQADSNLEMVVIDIGNVMARHVACWGSSAIL